MLKVHWQAYYKKIANVPSGIHKIKILCVSLFFLLCFFPFLALLIISFSQSKPIPFCLEMIGVGRQGRQIVPGVYSCGHQETFLCSINL